MTRKLVDFIVKKPGDKQYPNGALIIKIIPGCKKEIREISQSNQGLDAQFIDVIEWQTCNGWTAIPEYFYGQLPALTSAILLSDNFEIDDRGDHILDVGMVYSYGGYQIRGEITVLLEHGKIVFDAYDYSLPALAVGTKVRLTHEPEETAETYEVVGLEPESDDTWYRPYRVRTKDSPFDGWYARRELVSIEAEQGAAAS